MPLPALAQGSPRSAHAHAGAGRCLHRSAGSDRLFPVFPVPHPVALPDFTPRARWSVAPSSGSEPAPWRTPPSTLVEAGSGLRCCLTGSGVAPRARARRMALTCCCHSRHPEWLQTSSDRASGDHKSPGALSHYVQCFARRNTPQGLYVRIRPGPITGSSPPVFVCVCISAWPAGLPICELDHLRILARYATMPSTRWVVPAPNFGGSHVQSP